ncbi:MAG: hypothetical protein JST90_14700 [Bacteroidetes bacterium]|nr:hypothetical protein [Bacteroidota bacterium]
MKAKEGLAAYLEATGAYESGDEALIRKVKEAYWRNYRKEHKRKARKKNRECSISLDTEKATILERAAKAHGLALSAFIGQAAAAYVQQALIFPNIEELRRIEQLLSLCYSEIQDRQTISGHEDTRPLLDSILRSEELIALLLSRPLPLEQALRKALKEMPHIRSLIIEIIQHHDNKIKGKEEA